MADSIDPKVMIGHVHLKVSDLERSEAFYRNVFGFDVMARYGTEASFLSAGGYHHHVGLNTWQSKGSEPAPPRHPGLFHFAILYPDRPSLARAVRRVLDNGVSLDGASDHGVSEAIYLHDPDNNGIEMYWDRPRDQWPRNPDGSYALVTEHLDVEGLLAEASQPRV